MHNILIVDDESGIQQSLKGVLEDEDYKVWVAGSGEACLDALRKRAFDLSCSMSGSPEWMDLKPSKKSGIWKMLPRSS